MDAVHEGMAFLLNSQVRTGPYAGGIPRGVRTYPDDGSGSLRTFNQRVTEIRIDYVQHALSAMIQYRELYFARPSRGTETESSKV